MSHELVRAVHDTLVDLINLPESQCHQTLALPGLERTVSEMNQGGKLKKLILHTTSIYI